MVPTIMERAPRVWAAAAGWRVSAGVKWGSGTAVLRGQSRWLCPGTAVLVSREGNRRAEGARRSCLRQAVFARWEGDDRARRLIDRAGGPERAAAGYLAGRG
ncbi:hypothetical protein GCM10007977_046080 [Dactylosporangium sucinum]|uniref:Uncharacterized protein n=1 Tax=Dactylosporangium sucinum TaxID=1424081 RepID=A0A917WYB2_9ACTN|nr:hypothetical protein GCM10007977_046080 [Dactylosporangium sucinum]